MTNAEHFLKHKQDKTELNTKLFWAIHESYFKPTTLEEVLNKFWEEKYNND